MNETTHIGPQNTQGARRQTHAKSNWFFLKIAGGPFYAYSALKHTGRKSGREYITPLSAYPLEDGFVLALLYGDATSVEWCRNVLTAGKCKLVSRGKEYTLERPEIVPAEQALPAFPRLMRRMLRDRGIQQFVWLHRTPAADGAP